jgi:hypothetical protein
VPQQVGKFDFSGIPAASQQQPQPQAPPAGPPPPFDFSGVRRVPETPAGPGQLAINMLSQLFSGAMKGAGNTAMNLGGLMHQIPGVSGAVDTLYGTPGVSQAAFAPDSPIRQDLKPQTHGEAVGMGAEQVGEFLIPSAQASKVATTVASHLPKAAQVLPHMAAQGVAGASVAGAQGGDPLTAGITSAIAPAVVKGAVGAARFLGSKAEPLVRAAIKPTVTAMRQVAGGSQKGLDQKASQLVKFIIENKVTTPEKAQAIFDDAERELQRLLTSRNPPTDAAMRAQRYLEALERSANKQALPASDVAAVRNAMAELLDGPMGKDVVKMIPMPHPTLIDPSGKPFQVLTPHTSRALRPDVPAVEAMTSARTSSKFQTRKQWGEQKGIDTEAAKTVERGQRDAVKAAIPEARPLLKKESQAIQSRDVLDRMAFRQGNREAVSLPAHVMAAGEVASGRVPVLAMASNWLRNNGLKAGIYADALKRAVETGNVQNAAWALERLGVAVPGAATGSR